MSPPTAGRGAKSVPHFFQKTLLIMDKNKKPEEVNTQCADLLWGEVDVYKIKKNWTLTQPAKPDRQEDSLESIILNDLSSRNVETLNRAIRLINNAHIIGCDGSVLASKQDIFFRVGGPVAIVKMMKDHPHDQGIQLGGIITLSNVLCMVYNQDHHTAVSKVGGIESIMKAMKRFDSDKSIFLNGIRALINTVWCHEANAIIFCSKLDGVPFVVETMSKFKHESEIVCAVCKLLRNVSLVEQLREPMFNADAVTGLAVAIDSQNAHDEIRSLAWQTMKLLMEDE